MKQLAIIIIFILSISSCAKKDLLSDMEAPAAGKVAFTIHVATGGLSPVEATKNGTKNGTSDSYINPDGIYLLVFDDSGHLTDFDKAMAVGSLDATAYYSQLAPTDDPRTIYIVANASNIIEHVRGTWKTTGDSPTTLTDIKRQLLKSPLPNAGGIITSMPELQPMTGSISVTKISSDISIGNSDSPVTLTRSTSKVTINVAAPLKSTVTGANLANAPMQGYVFIDADPKQTITTAHYGTEEQGTSGMLSIMEANSNHVLYCYPSESSNGIFVVIRALYKGVQGFYRIDIKKTIEANHNYNVNINSINAYGYRTADEAISNRASNDVEYDITVTEPNAHDIVSNGEYYLGSSNSEVIIYNSDRIINTTIATISHNPPATVLSGFAAASNGIQVTQNPFNTANNGAEQSAPLAISMDANVMSGSIVLKLGNLVKTITVVRRKTLDPIEEAITDFGSDEYITAEAVGTPWITARSNPSGGLQIKTTSNVGFGTSAAKRSGSLYIARSNDNGRVLVLATQDYLNTYSGSVPPANLTYVGTFHRHDQTAERIIRIKSDDPSASATWRAVVISGDFIKLSTTRSPDNGIGTVAYGVGDDPLYTTDNQIEENCQVDGTQTSVSGLGPDIYFRVGLTSTLASAQTAPRYGLIALQHSKGTQLIYVRQGEAADYLMRPEDPMTSPADLIQSTRNKASKFSPYNLTDPAGQTGRINLGTNGYNFTQYPSQSGYYFMATATDAFHPTDSPNTPGTISSMNRWNPAWETCPVGYRRPNDGVNTAYNTGPAIKDSELRQSLWIYPRTGIDKAKLQNGVQGYLADGFFDRRPLRQPSTSKVSPYSTTGYDHNIAYTGTLLFNPYNNASLFFPESGYKNFNGFASAGYEGLIWSSTLANANQSWIAIYGKAGVNSTVVFDNYYTTNSQGYNIRCIKE